MTELPRRLSAVEGNSVVERDLILHDYLKNSALKYANQWAVISLHQSHDLLGGCFSKRMETDEDAQTYLRWTYSDVWCLAELLAKALLANGFEQSKPIVVLLHNQAEWAVAWWSAIRLGATFVPINAALEQNLEEIKHQVRMLQPGALIVCDTSVADTFDALGIEELTLVKLKLVARPRRSTSGEWKALEEVLLANISDKILPEIKHFPTDVTTCFFTGGTTSAPKPAPRTSQMDTLGILCQGDRHQLGPGRRVVGHLPNFHSYGSRGWMAAWTHGGCVVFPARSYSPAASLQAIEKVQCNYMPASPSMLDSLINHPAVDSKLLESLDTVILSGSLVHPDLVKRVRATPLNATHATGSFGMSEVGLIAEWDLRETQPDYTSAISVGKILPGMKWRICYQDTLTIVPHGEAGELHVGSTFMYHGCPGRNEDWLYMEDTTKWVRTGDQACLGDHDELYILGRYKDLIIRGGKNISPALIESVFSKIGLKAEVVGVNDKIAGEVPVAIVDYPTAAIISEEEMQTAVVNALGRNYMPQRVLKLQDLNLEEFPRTPAGKPDKKLLLKIAEQICDQNSACPVQGALMKESPHLDSTAETLRHIWRRLGAPKSLSLVQPVTDFADSLVILQAVNLIGKYLNRAVAPDEILACPTIEQQALIINRRNAKANIVHDDLSQRIGPPLAAEMVHVQNDQEKFNATTRVIAPVLSRLGLVWDDVEDIFPVCDNGRFMLETACRSQSWNQRIAFKAEVTLGVMQQALRETLKRHPMFRSFAVKYSAETWLHVIVRASQSWLDHLITVGPSIASEKELRTYRFNDRDYDHASASGALYKITILPLRDSAAVGILIHENHSVFDALSSSMWLYDLNLYLCDRWNHRTSTVPYKLFAEAFYFGRNGAVSQKNCEFFAQKLRNCASDKRAQWPRQRVREWMLGPPVGWRNSGDHPQERKCRPSHYPDGPGYRGLKVSMEIPDDIHAKLGFSGVALFTASIAMLNVHKTGANYALFSHWEAARTFPFQEGNLAYQSMLPSPTDIAGPTGQRVVDKIYVSSTQKVEDLLSCIQADIRSTSLHAHAPLFEIVKMLAESESARNPMEDAETFMGTVQRQVLDWIPNFQALNVQDSRAAHKVQHVCRSDLGLDWTGSRLDQRRIALSVCWDDAQLEEEEMRSAFSEAALAMKWLADPSNMHRSVLDCWNECSGKLLGANELDIAQE